MEILYTFQQMHDLKTKQMLGLLSGNVVLVIAVGFVLLFVALNFHENRKPMIMTSIAVILLFAMEIGQTICASKINVYYAIARLDRETIEIIYNDNRSRFRIETFIKDDIYVITSSEKIDVTDSDLIKLQLE